MARLAKSGLLIHLALPPALLEERLTNITTRGIAMRPGQSLGNLYAERLPLCQRYADFTASLKSGLTAEEVVTCLARDAA